MQIHEITQRSIQEGFGSALAGQLMTKALGMNPLDQSGPAMDRTQGFQSMVNSPAAKTLATTMQAAWTQTVKNFLANAKDSMGNPATSVKGVTQPSTDALKNELRVLINKMIGGARGAGFDYANMANNIGDEVAKQGVQEVIARINEYSEAIFKATVLGIDPKVLANDWVKLVGDGILPAQNAMAYDRGTTARKVRVYQDPSGKWVIDLGNGPEWLDKTKREHKDALEKMYGGAA